MWVIRFRPEFDGDPIKLYAEDVNLMDMPLVYIHGIRKKHRSTLIHLPDDDAYVDLVECDPLIIPVSSIMHIGKLKEETQISELRKLEEADNNSGVSSTGRG